MAQLSVDQVHNLYTVELWNCRNAFEFVCPRYFAELDPTNNPDVRFCGVCQERVYLACTPLDFVTHGELGHCVAIPEGYDPMGGFSKETLGRPTPQDIEERDNRIAVVRAWWQAVLAEQPRFAPEAIAEMRQVFGRSATLPQE